jgi:hypothetical protein
MIAEFDDDRVVFQKMWSVPKSGSTLANRARVNTTLTIRALLVLPESSCAKDVMLSKLPHSGKVAPKDVEAQFIGRSQWQ